jgi:hypothetical protein
MVMRAGGSEGIENFICIFLSLVSNYYLFKMLYTSLGKQQLQQELV